jgi:hypothetical protein
MGKNGQGTKPVQKVNRLTHLAQLIHLINHYVKEVHIVTTGERIFVGVFKLVMTRRIVSLSRGRRITVIGINKYIEY